MTSGKLFHLSGSLWAFSVLKFSAFIVGGSRAEAALKDRPGMTRALLSSQISGALPFGPIAHSCEEVGFLRIFLSRR